MTAARRGRVPLASLILLAGAAAYLGWARIAGPLKPDPKPAPPPALVAGVELVRWEPNLASALERAGREGRPVFLYLEAWGAEPSLAMRRECFTDPALAGLIASQFVPARVDAEDRPDLAEAYRTAAGVMGVQARLPLALCLLPEGTPFYATGYLPPGRLSRDLERVASSWKQKRSDLEGSAAKAAAQATQLMDPALPSINPSGTILRNAAIDLLVNADPQHGGFGLEAKELAGARLEFLVQRQRRRPQPEIARFLAATLDAMAAGAVYDQVGGGFHHGSTHAAWLAPAFEKRLDDNAQMAVVYLVASQALRQPEYRRVAEETLGFMLRDLRQPDGSFAAGLSAEAAGRPGSSYRWTADQLREALGPADRAALVAAFRLTGGTESPGLLYRAPAIPAAALTGDAASTRGPGVLTLAGTESVAAPRLRALRGTLLAARRGRPQPSLDRRFLPAANGAAICALAMAYEVTRAVRYRDAAVVAARATLRRLSRSGRLPGSSPAQATGPATAVLTGRAAPRVVGGIILLDDFAALARGLMELRLATGDPRWGRAARAVIDRMNDTLWNDTRSRYYRVDRSPWPGAWPTGERDGAGPSPTAEAALALLAYARVAPADRAATEYGRAARLLRACAARAAASPETNAGVLAAIDMLRAQPAPKAPAIPEPPPAPAPAVLPAPLGDTPVEAARPSRPAPLGSAPAAGTPPLSRPPRRPWSRDRLPSPREASPGPARPTPIPAP